MTESVDLQERVKSVGTWQRRLWNERRRRWPLRSCPSHPSESERERALLTHITRSRCDAAHSWPNTSLVISRVSDEGGFGCVSPCSEWPPRAAGRRSASPLRPYRWCRSYPEEERGSPAIPCPESEETHTSIHFKYTFTFDIILHEADPPHYLRVHLSELLLSLWQVDHLENQWWRVKQHDILHRKPVMCDVMTELNQGAFLQYPHQIVVCVFGLEHARDVSQVAQVRLLEAVLREGHRDNALRHIGEVEFISLLHLQTEDAPSDHTWTS